MCVIPHRRLNIPAYFNHLNPPPTSPLSLSLHRSSLIEQMLPYQTISEAASALGRNLTFGETLWFNYSASKSDYFLYCHNILFLFVIFSLVPLPLVFVEVLRWAGFDRYKIQPKVRLTFSDMVKCYKDVMWMFFSVVGPLQLVSYPSIQV